MDYQILIHDFVDGTLDKSQEESLFLALSSSDELRNELRQSIALEKAFGKKLSSFAPSAKSTVTIFSGLSMAIPGSSSAAGLASSSKTIAFISKYIQAIVGSFATALVATAVFFGINSTNSDDSLTIPVNSVVNRNIDIAGNQFDIPRMYSAEITKPIIKILYKNVPVASNNNDGLLKENPIETETISIPVLNEKPETVNLSEGLSSFSNLPKRNEFSIQPNYLTFKPSNEPHFQNIGLNELGFSLEFHGNQNLLQQNPEVPESSKPLFSNSGLTFLYHFNKNLSAGFDIRQEFIYQKFDGTDEDGSQYLYKQYPNYISISGVFRYGFDINEWLGVYSQVMAGGTVTGGVLRSGLGLKFSPYPRYNILIGLDGMIFGYQHQNKFYSASKLGLNFGIGFNF